MIETLVVIGIFFLGFLFGYLTGRDERGPKDGGGYG